MTDPVMQNNSSPDIQKGSSRALIGYTVVALGLALFIRFFVAAPYVVSGASMEPSFENWDYLIIDRLSYRVGEPQRGDVVVFDLPQDPSRSLIKRVIGVPGETVILEGNNVTIVSAEHPQGLTLDEPYLDPENLTDGNHMRMTLEPGEYFVLGDNRRVSADSRVWGILPHENIVGKVFVRLYPFNMIGFLPAESRYSEE